MSRENTHMQTTNPITHSPHIVFNMFQKSVAVDVYKDMRSKISQQPGSILNINLKCIITEKSIFIFKVDK